MTISAYEMLQKLNGVPEGAEVFVSYVAGGKVTERAKREARKAKDLGVSTRWLSGKVVSLRQSKAGDPILTIFTALRYDERTGSSSGNYRSINPNLGQLLSLELI